MLRFVLFEAAFLAAVSAVWNVRADEANREQPSATGIPKSEVATNSLTFMPRESGLKQLEQDLFKPFEKIAPKGSLDGAFVPPAPEPSAPPPVIQSKRAKELLERRRDWVFETPDEILSTTTYSDNANNHKDKEDDKSKLSPIQRFYERLYHKDEKNPNRSSTKKRDELYDPLRRGSLSDDADTDDDADLPLAVRETQREMRKLLMLKERKDEPVDTSPFSDAFGLGKPTRSPEEIETQRERMDQYKQLLGLPIAPRIENDPLKLFRNMIGAAPQSPTPVPTMNSLGTLPGNMFATQPGSALGGANNRLLPEGAQFHSTTPSLAPALPKIEPPKSLPPPVNFSAPRRAF